MAPNKQWGRVLVAVALGRWHWHPMLQDVSYIPRGKRRPVLVIQLRTQQNTEVGALRAIIREISPRVGGAR